MFKKFFKFLYGYVIIKVYGKGAERFINICLRRNIDVWNIKPFDDGIEMCIYIKDFFPKTSSETIYLFLPVGTLDS